MQIWEEEVMGAKILAVDDEEGILRLLKRALERDGAHVKEDQIIPVRV